MGLYRIIAAVLVLGWASLAQAAVDAADPAVTEVRAQIAARGRVSVIVAFRMTAPPRAVQLAPGADAGLSRQHAAVEHTGGGLIAQLAAKGIIVDQSFENLPQLIVTLDADQLDYVIGLDDVTSLHVNTPRRARELTPELRALGAPLLDLAQPKLAANDPVGTNETTRFMKADAAWARGFTGTGQTIVILDDGIDDTHPMFAGHISSEACFSPAFMSGDQSLCPAGVTQATGAHAAAACPANSGACVHGTHVTGIAGGISSALRGVAYNAALLPIQIYTLSMDPDVCGSSQRCLISYDSAQLSALNYVIGLAASTRIASVNMSLGGDPVAATCDSDPMKPAVDTLRALGVLTTMAAGNEGQRGIVDPPGCISSAITVSSVGASDPDGSTNHAPTVDVLAPGIFVNSAIPGGYGVKSGSSMSTAQVAGAIALLKSAQPSASAATIENALKLGGVPTRATGWTWTTPRVDVSAALDILLGTTSSAPAGVAVTGVHTSRDRVSLSFLRFHNSGTSGGLVTVTVLSPDGTRLGVWSKNFGAGSSPQFYIGTIEAEAVPPIDSGANSGYTLYVDSPNAGHVQHVIWNPIAQSLMDMSGCAAGLSSDTRQLINVHTTVLSGYPSYALVQNTGTVAAAPTFNVRDATNGQDLGTFTTSAAIPPLGTALIPVSSAMEFLGYTPQPNQGHINLTLAAGYPGFAQHIVNNLAQHMITNLTPKCDM